MSVYVIAQLTFTDRGAYDRYAARFMEAFRPSGGRVLVSDERPEVLEGRWEQDKVVVLWFPDEPAARRFLRSAEYRDIATDRHAGARAVVLLARGSSPP